MPPDPRRPTHTLVLAAACLVLGALGGSAAALTIQSWRGERIVHDYILAHPEVLPQAMDNLRRQQDAAQLAGMGSDIAKPWPGAVLGNPQGKQVLVEFTDYACGFCRRSIADVDRLIAARPNLKVVVRELPILTPESADAARMALAAAAQGRYAAFHAAMFASGRPSADTIAQAAAAAGLDMARARQTIANPATQAEIDRNLEYARALGLNGTPSWIAGDHLLAGAIGADALAQALDGATR